MGFIAALPWIASLVGTAAGLYGQNKANQNAKSLRNSQQPFVDQQLQNMQFLAPYGQQMAQSGQQNMGMVQSYLRNLMSGDRGLTMQTMAPEINNLTQQYQGAIQAQRSQMPRGGTSAGQAGNLGTQLQGNINNLLFSARPMASQQLAGLGSQQSSLGLGALGGAGGLTNNMLNYGLNAQQQMFGQGQQIGQGIGNFISPFLQYYMMNMGGNKSASASPYMTPTSPANNPYGSGAYGGFTGTEGGGT